MWTRTIYVDLEKLYAAGKSEASLILRLMLACNDISIANNSLGKVNEEKLTGSQEHIRLGARTYFVRLQAGHLHEAIKLIDELVEAMKKNPLLGSIYDKCLSENKEDFLKLKECLKKGSNHADFFQNVSMLRNKTIFHYNENRLFEKAVANRISNKSGNNSSITVSNDVRYLRFNVADDILDTLVCRLIWKIDDNSKLREETDRRAIFCFELCKAFVNFCSEFSFKYIQEHAARS